MMAQNDVNMFRALIDPIKAELAVLPADDAPQPAAGDLTAIRRKRSFLESCEGAPGFDVSAADCDQALAFEHARTASAVRGNQPPPAWAIALENNMTAQMNAFQNNMTAQMNAFQNSMTAQMNALAAQKMAIMHEIQNRSIRAFNASAVGDNRLEGLRNRDGQVSEHFPATLADFHLLTSARLTTLLEFYGLPAIKGNSINAIAKKKRVFAQAFGLRV